MYPSPPAPLAPPRSPPSPPPRPPPPAASSGRERGSAWRGWLEARDTAGLPVDQGEQEVLQHHAHHVPAGDEEAGQTETEQEMFSESCSERGDGD